MNPPSHDLHILTARDYLRALPRLLLLAAMFLASLHLSQTCANARSNFTGAPTSSNTSTLLFNPTELLTSGALGGFGGFLKGGCFVAGTMVATEHGFKRIEDIKEGDLVWTRNPRNGKVELKPVTATMIRQVHGAVTVKIVALASVGREAPGTGDSTASTLGATKARQVRSASLL